VNSFSDFLAQFVEQDNRNTSSQIAAPYYETLAKAVAAKDRTTLEVDFQHLQQFDDELAERIAQDYYRIEKWLAEALKGFTKKAIPAQDQVHFPPSCAPPGGAPRTASAASCCRPPRARQRARVREGCGAAAGACARGVRGTHGAGSRWGRQRMRRSGRCPSTTCTTQ
jgi:DNA replicative helicase MCM subunit Mcm2 (Cdc46/Mcm family)